MDRNRRNFLRENKLSLRELQRVTNKSKMQQQQEQLLREQKYAGRRSQSQQRNNNICLDVSLKFESFFVLNLDLTLINYSTLYSIETNGGTLSFIITRSQRPCYGTFCCW